MEGRPFGRCDAANQFDPEASTVEGNADGMQLLGFSEAESVPWSAVRRSIVDAEDWPAVLERAIPSITAGSLPPALPPFFSSDTLYIPVITRAQSVDDVLKELVLIFVAADTDPLRRMLDWSLPAAMPDPVADARQAGADDVQGSRGTLWSPPTRKP